MKKRRLFIGAALCALLAGTSGFAAAQNVLPNHPINIQGSNPGIAMAGSVDISRLPKKIQKFLHEMGEPVVKSEKEFPFGTYEIELASGIDIEFNRHGKMTEIDSPDNTVLSDKLVKRLVPRRLYDNLREMGLNTSVSSISVKKGGYELDFDKPGSQCDEAAFTSQGELIAMYYD